MKRGILIILMLIIGIFSLFGEIVPFNSEFSYPNIILACFDEEFIGNNEGILNFEIDNGLVKTGYADFDELSLEIKIINFQLIG